VFQQGFLYKNNQLLAEVDDQSLLVSRFVYATSHYTPDYMIQGGTRYRLVKDQLDSVRLVVNTSTGAIAQRLDYDAFGNVTNDTNPGFQPFGFAGGLYDPDTGLTRFGARDYDAESGRWTAKDPIRFRAGDANLYVYAANNPVNYYDPLGLQAKDAKECTFVASNVKGDINITPQGCKDGFQPQVVGPIEDGFVVKEGDVIETGKKSRIKLSNPETGTTLMLGSGSKLEITNDLCFGVSELP
jgi:RHS repeat-associated protein